MPLPRNLLLALAHHDGGEAYGRGGAGRTEIGRAVAVRVARPRMRGREPEELRDEI
jgi:hypothetical protein